MERRTQNNYNSNYNGGYNKGGNNYNNQNGGQSSQGGFTQVGAGGRKGGQQQFTSQRQQQQAHGYGNQGGRYNNYEGAGNKGGYYNNNPEFQSTKSSHMGGAGASCSQQQWQSSRPQTGAQSTRKQSDPFQTSAWGQEESKIAPVVPRLPGAGMMGASPKAATAIPSARSTAVSNDESTHPSSGRSVTSTTSSGFSSKPQASQLVTAAKAVGNGGGFTGGQAVQLLTNQYRLRLGLELAVYQYDVQVQPDHMSDTFIMQGIFRTIKRKVDQLLSLYVTSGRSVFTTTKLDESLQIPCEFRGMQYEVLINHESERYFSGKQLTTAKMEDHSIMHTLLNIIVKQAFRETQLRQIGKQPRFFDVSKAIEVEGSGLMACPGFRASAFNYTSGLTIVLDNINKFISNKTCLERIHEIQEMAQRGEIKDVTSRILHEFQYKTVIGAYGMRKTYMVEDIDFKLTPVTKRFETHDGKKMSIAEYFLKTYSMKVTDMKQPLFLVKINGKECHIPPEFCTIDGVPQTIREDPRRMRDVLASCRKNPAQKFKSIQDFSKDLFKQKALKDWGVIIEPEPIQIQSQILPMPTMELANGRTANIDQNCLKNLPIQKPSEALSFQRWVIVYEKRHFNQANGLFQTMQQASAKLGLNVEEPNWIEIERGDDTFSCERQLKGLIDQKMKPSIAVMMLSHERLYKQFKHVFYSHQVVSQCIQYKNFGKGINLSVASNVLRQINSKLGGDLFALKFSKELSPMTMLIGIDVCHSGPSSIVGFCASINKARSQYYSERIVQKKGQEIVNKQLKDAIKRALGCFQEKHGDYPQHFIIYRDGVGDAMRRQVLQEEVQQLRQAINETYNTAKKKPVITVIIVNKRITQRFFIEDGRGQLLNPPSGALIDSKIVENQDSQTEYDFYLVPQFTTQGCILPTHFYVAYNDSQVEKATIEKLTFDLCHYYFNWAGAIKVPAPCMYAHKIAELFMNLGKEARQIEFSERIAQSLHFL